MSMGDSGVRDTTAYKIIRQMTDHIWGADEKLDDETVLAICRLFASRGGEWESLVSGSMEEAVRLEEAIGAVVRFKRNGRVAARVAAKRVT